MDSDHREVLKIQPLRDAFLARELEGRRFNKTQEDVWISNIARDVERDEHAVRPRYVMIPAIPVICKLIICQRLLWLQTGSRRPCHRTNEIFTISSHN